MRRAGWLLLLAGCAGGAGGWRAGITAQLLEKLPFVSEISFEELFYVRFAIGLGW